MLNIKRKYLDLIILFFTILVLINIFLYFKNPIMETLVYSVGASTFFISFIFYLTIFNKPSVAIRKNMFYIFSGSSLFLSTVGLCLVLIKNKPIMEMLISKIIYVIIIGTIIIIGSKTSARKNIYILPIVSSAFVLSSFVAQKILKNNSLVEILMVSLVSICIFVIDIIIIKNYIGGEKV